MRLTVAVALILTAVGCSSAPTLVYVTSSDGSLAVIDTDRMETTTRFEVAGGPWGIDSSASGPRVYIANFYGKTVVGIDTRTNTIEETIYCYYPWGVAVKPPAK